MGRLILFKECLASLTTLSKLIIFFIGSKKYIRRDEKVNNVPKDIFFVSFQDLQLDNQGNLFPLVKLLMDHLKTESKKGLYIYGDMGIGKTYVMAAFSHMLASQNKQVAFISVSQLLQDLKSYFNSSQDNGLDELKEVDYCCGASLMIRKKRS